MFKLVDKRTAWWPVVFAGVAEDGAVVSNSIELQFEILAVDELTDHLSKTVEFEREAEVAEGAEAQTLSRRMAEYCGRFVLDWRGVGKANGDPLDFTPDNLARLLNVPNAFTGTMEAYRACIVGRAEVRAGN